MFSYEDKRTDEERQRDVERGDKLNNEGKLALGFLTTRIRTVLEKSGIQVGLVGKDSFYGAEMLLEEDGITYKLRLRVDHDT